MPDISQDNESAAIETFLLFTWSDVGSSWHTLTLINLVFFRLCDDATGKPARQTHAIRAHNYYCY